MGQFQCPVCYHQWPSSEPGRECSCEKRGLRIFSGVYCKCNECVERREYYHQRDKRLVEENMKNGSYYLKDGKIYDVSGAFVSNYNF